jgi:predicted PurR-regulated permease PerM
VGGERGRSRKQSGSARVVLIVVIVVVIVVVVVGEINKQFATTDGIVTENGTSLTRLLNRA